MKRKVIQIGKFTQVVSLPRDWTKKNSLEKGNELNIEEVNNKLIVGVDGTSPLERITLDLRDNYEYNIRDIKAIYRCGYDEVEVLFDNIRLLNKIQHTMSEQLLGFEIVNQTENSCTIKSLVRDSEYDFDLILRRLFLLTISMAEESYGAISTGNLGRLNEIQAMERMNNKLCNLCERTLHKSGYKDSKKVFFLYALLRELDQIADQYRDICSYMLSANNSYLSKDVLIIYKKVNDMLKESYDLFSNLDLVKLGQLKNKREKLEKEASELFSKKKGEDQMTLHYLMTILFKINHLKESIN